MDQESLVIWGSLLVWLGAIILFLVMTRLLISRLKRLFHTRLHSSMEAAEFIVRTGQAPAAWAQRLLPTDPWEDHVKAFWRRAEIPAASPQTRCLRRLEELIRFFETAPVYQEPDARSMLLTELQARQEGWRRNGVVIAAERDAVTPPAVATQKIGGTG